ncbi:MAG: hypothetical protein FJ138_00290 [Deltaproteobacteria bacterium]|nr:hypothetical protein [Deltaproteobacteria bacterium]
MSIETSKPATPLSDAQRLVVAQEEEALKKVMASLAHLEEPESDLDAVDEELLALREQLQEAHEFDRAAILDQMNRLAALRQNHEGRDDKQSEAEFLSAPYFARILYQEEDEDGEPRGPQREVFIGKRSFFSPDGRVKVVDWRTSPLSRLYYMFREGDEFYERLGDREVGGQLKLRRALVVRAGELRRIQYGVKGDLTLERSFAGEWSAERRERAQLTGGEGVATRVRRGAPPATADALLPEISALIDPEQFKLITHEQSGVVVIQGGAGTGKTTIALHRVAYLHFQNPKRYHPRRMLILTPGVALKRYVSQVLPALDVAGAPIHTFGEWAFESAQLLCPSLKHHRLVEHTHVGAQRLKRQLFTLQLLERAVREECDALEEGLERAGGKGLLAEWRRLRDLPQHPRLKRLYAYAQGAPERFSSTALRELERAQRQLRDPKDTWADLFTNPARLGRWLEELGAPAPERELRVVADLIHQQARPPELLSDVDEDLRVGADGVALSDDSGRGRLDPDDCALILRLAQLKYGALTGPSEERLSYEHVMVDEAQDLSPVALQVLCGATPPHAPVTLAGDTAQRVIFDNGFSRWGEVLPFLPAGASLLPPLKVSYRSTRQIMELARHVLGDLAHDWTTRDLRDGPAVAFTRFEERGEAVQAICDALGRLMDAEPRATVAVVARTPQVADRYFEGLRQARAPKVRRVAEQDFSFSAGVDVTDVRQVKGLEYDYVIALDVTAEHYPLEESARHLLHVLATRAAHQLWIVNAGEATPSLLLPPQLTAR